jgi:hypothetical protein
MWHCSLNPTTRRTVLECSGANMWENWYRIISSDREKGSPIKSPFPLWFSS